jgi:hypothetical protein
MDTGLRLVTTSLAQSPKDRQWAFHDVNSLEPRPFSARRWERSPRIPPNSPPACSAGPERRVGALNTAEDLAAIEAKGGVLEQVRKLRDRKVPASSA